MNRTRYARPRLAAIAAVAAAITACGGSDRLPTAPAGGLTISSTPSLTFSPASLTVSAGDVVTFAFGAIAHNVFFDAAAGAPANIEGSNASVSVTRTFTSPGAYHYTCHIHAGMQGTVTVR
jgi:plastocyanin